MGNTIIITNRLIWIDWAKALAITLVVFGHTPIEKGNFLQNYIVVFHMPLFFFISGFLTKEEFFSKITLKKYWNTLIIPYFCYNIIFYPYWVVRHSIDYPYAGWYDYIKPIIGTFMLQHKTAYYESLNGVTWFIVSLLIMKIILAICNKYKKGGLFIILLSICTTCFYIVNEAFRFVTDLPFVGFTKCCAFFYLGFYCKQKNYIYTDYQKKDIFICLLGIISSIYFFSIFRNGTSIVEYGILYWLICLSAIWGILSLCKLLNKVHFTAIDNISIGTIVIMGLHRMFIGATNYGISMLFGIQREIVYPLITAILIALFFVALEYPIIIFFKNNFPFMLGKNRIQKC
ncbi:acyltransferase family protein [Prevotella sp. P6B1]|uniref:acyltransferase family protein n=1 Tax=Prevotella sp. P6B1 TaxID=1410613 RepID=UPI00051BBF92|nr:acyltransferase family protein [Prevotella sp. P6B1]